MQCGVYQNLEHEAKNGALRLALGPGVWKSGFQECNACHLPGCRFLFRHPLSRTGKPWGVSNLGILVD